MGGQIEVFSQLVQGSTFSFELSLTVCHVEDICLTDKVVEPEDISLNKNILVVDDTRINRKTMKMAFDQTQANLFMAESGIECFKKHVIDIVLMDCLMPQMDGFEATRQIRALESPEYPVLIIAVTACTSEEIGSRVKDSSMDDIMLKSFKFHELLLKINYWLMLLKEAD